MNLLKSIVILFAFTLLSACGGGGSGGSSGGGGETPDQTPQLNLNMPSVIQFGSPITRTYSTENNVSSISVSSVSQYLSVNLNTQSRTVNIELLENVTATHTFTITYGNADETRERTFTLTSEEEVEEVVVEINGVVVSDTLNTFALLGEENNYVVEVVSGDTGYTLSVISTTQGIEASVQENTVIVGDNEFTVEGVQETVSLRLSDDQNNSLDINMNVEFSSNNLPVSSSFCFVGYCEVENPETTVFYDLGNSEPYEGHFRGMMYDELVFEYRVPFDFGEPVSVEVNSQDISDMNAILDSESQEIILQLNNSNNFERNNDIQFTIENSNGVRLSVNYIVSLTPSRGSADIVLEPFNNIIVLTPNETSRTFNLGLPDNDYLYENGEIEIATIQKTIDDNVRLFFDVDFEGNELTISAKTDQNIGDSEKWWDHEDAPSSFEFGIWFRCTNCSGFTNDGQGLHFTVIKYHFHTQRLLDELAGLENEYQHSVMYGASFFELDMAIHYLDDILKANNIVIMEDNELNEYLRVFNDRVMPMVAGFRDTFLMQEGLNWYEGVNSFNRHRRFFYNPNYFGITGGRYDGYFFDLRTPQEQYERYWEEMTEKLQADTNSYNARNPYVEKIKILNQYVDVFNEEFGTEFSHINYSDLSSLPVRHGDRYGFLEGNLAYGEWVDDVFVFSDEYQYLQGLNDLLESYISDYY